MLVKNLTQCLATTPDIAYSAGSSLASTICLAQGISAERFNDEIIKKRSMKYKQFYCKINTLRTHIHVSMCVPMSKSRQVSYRQDLYISNIEILERFQSKALRMTVGAPWYVPNTVIRRDIQIPKVKEENCRYSSQYRARLSAHPNDLIVNHMELPENRRLRRHLPNDLPTRFLV
jgi:hypothetical protein